MLGFQVPSHLHSPPPPTMAGLTSTLCHPCKSQLPKSAKPFSFQFQTFPLRLQFSCTTRYPSISTAITARYRGVEEVEDFSSSEASDDVVVDDDDDALDVSSLESNTVRLIDEQQSMVGIVSKDEAIEKARDANLDLVIIAAEADPPVVRMMDFDKYRYQLQRKERDQQKKNSAGRVGMKEVKMGYKIDDHDYSVRLKAAQKFLKEGDKVKVLVRLKGRENRFRNNAIELIRQFQNDLGELAIEESKNFREKDIFMVLAPKKAVVR